MNQNGRLSIAFLLLAVIVLAGCQGQSILDAVFPQQEEAFGISESEIESSENIVEKTLPTPNPPEFINLSIWVPQQFDFAAETEAAVLFSNRFKEFAKNNPQINLNVRTKPVSGPGSIIETLTSASAVAPGAVPSLILISRSDMVLAASKNLLFPVAGLSDVMEQKDWFDVARELGIFEGTIYCVPFASNALGLVYKQPEFNNDQPNWAEVIRQSDKLLFSSGDPEAITTIALYLSAGGNLPGKSGSQILDSNAMTSVLSAYDTAAKNGRIPDSILDLQTDDQVWEAFLSSNQGSVLTWTNRALAEPGTYKLAMLPSLGNETFTLAGGWLWCMTEPDEQDRIQALELANYLSAPEFLELWAPISGYLPVRPSSIHGFEGSDLQKTILNILISARVRPDKSQISEIGVEIKRAISEVLLQQKSPEESAQNIILRLEAMNSQ